MAARRSIERLDDAIMHKILTKVPLLSIVVARQVSKKWKKIIDSKVFGEDYTELGMKSAITVLQRFDYDLGQPQPRRAIYEVSDGESTQPFPDAARFGWHSCPITGRRAASIRGTQRIFAWLPSMVSQYGVWSELPMLPGFHADNVGSILVVSSTGADYKLVYWEGAEMWLFSNGEWKLRRSADNDVPLCPVAIGEKVYVVETSSENLLVYDPASDKFDSKVIDTGAYKEIEKVMFEGHDVYAWQEDLYVLVIKQSNDGVYKRFLVWKVTKDGSASCLLDHGFRSPVALHKLRVQGMEDGKVFLLLKYEEEGGEAATRFTCDLSTGFLVTSTFEGGTVRMP